MWGKRVLSKKKDKSLQKVIFADMYRLDIPKDANQTRHFRAVIGFVAQADINYQWMHKMV